VSRSHFDSMSYSMASQDDEDAQQVDMRYRKAIYQGHCHFRGVQSDAYVATLFVQPGDMPGRFNLAQLRVKMGMRCLRPNVQPIVDMARYGYKQSEENKIAPQPFDPVARDKYNAAIIPEFSSQPFPQLSTHVSKDGRTWTKLINHAIGLRGSNNLVTGNIWRNSKLFPLPPSTVPGFGMTINIPYPVSVLYGDLIVHRASFPDLHQQVSMYDHATMGDEVMLIREYQSPMVLRERLAKLPMPLKNLTISEVPQYRDMVEYCAAKMNFKVEDYDVYRFRMEYPLIDTMLQFWMSLQPSTVAEPVASLAGGVTALSI